MNKTVAKVVVLLALVICVIIFFKTIFFGVVVGALASIVYFSLTGSTLNWKKK